MKVVARFPLAVVRSALKAKTKNLRNPQAICSMQAPVNVHCGSEPLIGWVGVSADFGGGYWGVTAYITATGFAFPA